MKNLIREFIILIGCEEYADTLDNDYADTLDNDYADTLDNDYADTLDNDIDGFIYLLILSGIVIVPIVICGIMGAISVISGY